MATGVAPTVTLNNGRQMPQLGLGTWLSLEGEAKEAVKYAIDIGYRHIDCAMLYGNEKEIGEAVREKIADGTVKREDLFITTKLWNMFHEYEQVVPTCKKSLENLGLDYVDLYLIHWPVAQKLTEIDPLNPFGLGNAVIIKHDFTETWKGMEECVRLGLTKSIGLSNFNSVQVLRILDVAKIMPVTNQIEVNPHLNQKKLIKFCKDRNIVITAYSPFGSPARTWAKPGQPEIAFDHPTFVKIGEKYGKTSSQVILRYLIDIGTVPIPKSTNKERLKLNLHVFDFKLDEDDISAIDAMNMDHRAVHALDLVESDDYPFKNVEF
ncbi:aldo-keto reductase family 1 member B1-like [Coccinella septempunctata]|uniref:aldo-keto reductase family 1 member B1-like n=1 Tax=Coccinella septempunctata TaxID=41139 RepID=UPI001D06848D|nr:aldo-keto reductase family 1 member B1-like [Coccinella septempunctata]XP_044762184.1 aldo-keto reductase family 1 member B1-like [Coccinella septempunctata]